MGRPMPLTWVWLTIPLVGVVASASLEPIPPHDYWWHLVMGRLIAGGVYPDSNLFLYSMPEDAFFLNQPWLGQWLLFSIREVGGDSALILLRNLLVAISWGGGIYLAFARSRKAQVVAILAVVLAVATFPVLTVRTRIFAFVPFVLLLWWILRFGTGDRRWFRTWIVVCAVAFWANTHGSFVLAPVMAFGVTACVVFEAWVDGTDWRSPFAFGAGATLFFLAAGAVSPLGLENYSYVMGLALGSSVAATVTEWRPPEFQSAEGAILLITTVVAVILLGLKRTSVRLWEVGVLLAVTYLGAGSVRSLFFWSMTMLVVLAPHLSDLLEAHKDEPTTNQGRINGVLLAVLVGAFVAVQPGMLRETIVASTLAGHARYSDPGRFVLGAETPTRAVDHLEGRVFHHQAIGGFLEFVQTEDGPRPVAFVDQRMEMIPESVWTTYFELSSAEGRWAEHLETYEIDSLLLSPQTQWKLVQEAERSDVWKLRYVDEAHVLFTRATRSHSEPNRKVPAP